MFEQSLQAINPMLTLPYWDFTFDSTFLEPSTFRNQLLFSDVWDTKPQTPLHSKACSANRLQSKIKVYTNEELYEKLDPNNPNLPYVYDNFRYHHCEVLGKLNVLLWCAQAFIQYHFPSLS
jgi:hypothetical protein